MCVYTRDYMAPADVDRVREGVSRALQGVFAAGAVQLRYKPDLYTYLNIYAKNDLGIRPTVAACVVP